MQLGSYTLNIGGKACIDGYVRMRHGEEYAVSMSSQSSKRTTAEVRVDGDLVGVWLLSPFQSVWIERPADVAKKFAFYAANSIEGQMVGAAQVANAQRGVVSVTFYPEKTVEPIRREYVQHVPASYTFDSYSSGTDTLGLGNTMRGGFESTAKGLSAGVTGLTGHSDQQFNTVAPIQRDYAAAVTIELRLVIDEVKNDPQPLPGRRMRMAAPPPVGY